MICRDLGVGLRKLKDKGLANTEGERSTMRKSRAVASDIKEIHGGGVCNHPFLQTGLRGGLGLGEVLITGEDPSVLLRHLKNKQTNCVLSLQYVLLVVY